MGPDPGDGREVKNKKPEGFRGGSHLLLRSEFWGALFWIGLGAFLAREGSALGLGSLNDPGSGFALFWVGALMLALAIPGLVVGLAAGGPKVPDLWTATRWGKVLLVLTLLVIFALVFERGGFILCTAVLLLT